MSQEGIQNPESIEKIKPRGIISGGPGIGKTKLLELLPEDISAVDLDPTDYYQDPRWPKNYIEDIERNFLLHDLVLISAHPQVVGVLQESGHEITVVCPDESLKEVYRARYIQRGNSEKGIAVMLEKGFRPREENQRNFAGCRVVFLDKPDQYLSDIIDI